MARDYNQARYVLKQGNVTSITVKDLNSEYNLLGFYNNRSVFECTDEKLNTEPKRQIENDIAKKAASDLSVLSKQIIIKPICNSSRIVLINDKNVKISVKKCTSVPKNILKMLDEKKHMQPANTDDANKSDNEQLSLVKCIRTYGRTKDKTYQNANIDSQNTKINTDLKEFSMIKDIADTCGSEIDTTGIGTVDIAKLTGEVLGDKSAHKVSVDKIKELLKGVLSKNLIVLKHPVEGSKINDCGELQSLNTDITEDRIDRESITPPNLNPVYINSCLRKNSISDTNKERSSVINLTENNKNTETSATHILDLLSNKSTNLQVDNEMCKEKDGNIKLKLKHVIANKHREKKHSVTDMGKIKHFKEKSSSTDKNLTRQIVEDEVGIANETKAYPKLNIDIADAELKMIQHQKQSENWGKAREKFFNLGVHPNHPFISIRLNESGTFKTPILSDPPVVSPVNNPTKDTGALLRLRNKRRLLAKTRNQQFIKQEIEKYLKESMSRKKKCKSRNTQPKTLAHNSCQTEVSLSDISTQTDFVQAEYVAVNSNGTPSTFEDVIPLEIDDSIIGSDVNFGNGPRMTPYVGSGASAVYNLGNNLDSLEGDVDIAPSQLVCANNMGYLDVVSGMTSVKLQEKRVCQDYLEKRAFQDYLKNCRVPDSAGNLPLHIEVMRNDFNEVRKQVLMLNIWKLPIDTVNANNLTPLHLAVIHKCDENIVSFLLDRDADLACTDTEGNTAMHLAVFHDSTTLLRVLLQRASDNDFNLNIFNYEGFSPLLLATIEDKLEMVTTFLEFHADPNVKDQKSGRTPLFHAVENNNLKMVQLLLSHDADKKIKNFSGTSTHDAVFELEGISADIKNMIIGKEQFTVINNRKDKRRREKTKDICPKKLKTVKTFRKIKIIQ